MSVNKIFIIITVLLWGWLLQDNNAYHLDDHYSVCISPQFPQSFVDPMLEGIGLWNQLGQDRFFLAAPNDVCNVLIAPATGTVAKTLEHQLGDPYVLGYADFQHHTIFIFSDKVYDTDDLISLSSHEAGHFIGLEHIPMERFAIMNPYRRYYGYIHPHLFRADVESYCRIWDCSNVDLDSIDDSVNYGTIDLSIDAGI